jgi:hypothetical protein
VEDVDGFPLIYCCRAHLINLFVWPSAATPEISQPLTRYHLRSWSSGGMTFWAVSDVNDNELALFVAAYRSL